MLLLIVLLLSVMLLMLFKRRFLIIGVVGVMYNTSLILYSLIKFIVKSSKICFNILYTFTKNSVDNMTHF